MGRPAAPDMVLLYDGVCAVCNRAVQLILRHDRAGTMRFAALQGAFARAVVGRHPRLAGADSVVVVERSAGGAERVYAHSDAALRVARYLGGWWRLALLAAAVPAPVRDAAYRLFARYRYRLFGRHEVCILPAPGVRARFLD